MRSLWFVALTAIALPAVAQDNDAPKKEEKKICRAVATTGSILGGKRQCHTKAEWNEIGDRDREQRDHLDRSMRGRNGGLGIDRNQ
jgi:hypothetical protein